MKKVKFNISPFSLLFYSIPFSLDCVSIIYQECQALVEDSCVKVLFIIMKSKDCKSDVLEFLMMKAWKSKKVDCSKISMRALIVDKRVIHPKLISRFLELGVVVSVGDVSAALSYFSDSDLDSFKCLLARCEEADRTDLCQQALKKKLMSFVLHFIEVGASLQNVEKILCSLLELKQFEKIKVVLKQINKETIEKLNLASLLETDFVMYYDLIEKFLDAGISPNGKKSPIVTVMNLSHLKPDIKIELICLLIKYGADINQLCQSSRDTTPLHVATEISLRAGMDIFVVREGGGGGGG